MLTVGSLFSGIGGFDLGLERAGYEIKWQVENNDYCRRVLQKHWSSVPCHYDITTIDWHWIPRVDLVCGGFPCQPFSCAEKQRGAADDRYLWPEVVRCLGSLRPAWFLGENVPGIVNLALDQVCTDLENLGYEVITFNIPACAVDAPHIRKRVWIVAHAASDIRGASRDDRSEAFNGSHSFLADSQDTNGRRADAAKYARRWYQEVGGCGLDRGRVQHWPTEPSVGRVADGIPHRVDRLRGLGNAIVPQIAEALGRMILQVHQEEAAL